MINNEFPPSFATTADVRRLMDERHNRHNLNRTEVDTFQKRFGISKLEISAREVPYYTSSGLAAWNDPHQKYVTDYMGYQTHYQANVHITMTEHAFAALLYEQKHLNRMNHVMEAMKPGPNYETYGSYYRDMKADEMAKSQTGGVIAAYRMHEQQENERTKRLHEKYPALADAWDSYMLLRKMIAEEGE